MGNSLIKLLRASSTTNIEDLPLEMIEKIFNYLEYQDLISVRAASSKLRSAVTPQLLASKLQVAVASSSQLNDFSEDVLDAAAEQINSAPLATETMTKLAAMIESSLSNCSRAAVVRCASSLAASGHLTSVGWMLLRDMELPSIQHIPALARVVRGTVYLRNVTGDLANLLANLSCQYVRLYDVELDEAATRGLVLGLQQGVAVLVLGARTRVHLHTLLDYDGRGRCGVVGCWDDVADFYREVVREWAIRVGWEFVEDGDGWITNR